MRYLSLNDNDRFSSMLDRMFDDFEDLSLPKQKTMPIEVVTKENEYTVNVELPGINKEDIDISIEGNKLSISAKRQTNEETATHSEFYYGQFSRAISLGEEIDKDKCVAEYKDGVLHLVLPKLVKDKTKKIMIK